MSSDRSVPQQSPESKPYWEAAREGRLIVQQCNQCEENIFHPRFLCPYCFSQDLSWIESTGEGTVYTYSVLHYAASDAWEDAVPYVNAIIYLNEDIYMYTHLVNCDPSDVEVGMEVTVTFEDVTDEVTLPKFEPK